MDADRSPVAAPHRAAGPPRGSDARPPRGSDARPPRGSHTEPPRGSHTEPPRGSHTEPPSGRAIPPATGAGAGAGAGAGPPGAGPPGDPAAAPPPGGPGAPPAPAGADPGRSRTTALDAALALALTAVSVASALTEDPSLGHVEPPPDARLVAAALVAGAALAFRRRAPVAVLAVTAAASTTAEWLGWEPDLIAVCMLVALFTVAVHRPPVVSVPCLAAVYAAGAVVWAVQNPPWYDGASLPEHLVVAGAWGVGALVRRWTGEQSKAQLRITTAERTRAEAADRAVTAERLRIARELHEVVSRTLTTITGLAADARSGTTGPGAPAAVLGDIERLGRTALEDLRRMLGALRARPAPPAGPAVPDTSVPTTSVPDTSVPTTSVPDTAVPDTAVPDTAGPDTAGPDTADDRPGPRDRLVDLGIGVIAAVLAVSGALAGSTDAYVYREPGPLLLGLTAAGALALAGRRTCPVPALAVTASATAAVVLLGGNAAELPLCLAVALYSAGAWRGTLPATAALFGVYALLGVLALLRAPYFDHPLALVSVLALTTAWALGRLARRRRHASRLAGRAALAAERQRDDDAERAALAERLRIARELHDVVGHSLSVITVRSGVARFLAGSQPAQAAPALAVIEQVGRSASDDLRDLLSVLAPGGEPAAPGPAPGRAELAALLDRATRGRLDVDAGTDVDGLPGSIRHTLYRLVQEAVTNATVHAPGAAVHVRIGCTGRLLTLRVDNDRGAPAAPRGDGGLGLLGMRERVTIFGGDLRAGRRPDGGFRVHATLPLRTGTGPG
ncbi:histidine kinase [Pseudonocardia kongjuensis]|uniref:histidine kinase n=1 Tax=Pseudonocardia kongjuensis TaxID=102227 RepID=UPI0031E35BFF